MAGTKKAPSSIKLPETEEATEAFQIIFINDEIEGVGQSPRVGIRIPLN